MTAVRLLIASIALSLFGLSTTYAQSIAWPNRPITLIVPYPPGAATDTIARLIRDPLERQLKQPVVIENRPGAAGTTGSLLAAKAEPDGYTLLVTVNAPLTMLTYLQKNFPFDPMKAFSPIIKVANMPMALAVNSKLPVHNVQELLDYVRKNPSQQFSYGSAGIGSGHHVAGELLKQKTGINMIHVPYRGGGPAIQDLVAGHIPISFGTLPALLPQAQAGTVRILALTEEKRLPDFSDMPTVTETVPGVIAYAWVGVFAPAGTPKNIIEKVRDVIDEAMKQPDFISKARAQGASVVNVAPDNFERSIRDEYEYWGRVIPSIGVSPE